jgi:hypothetical protein
MKVIRLDPQDHPLNKGESWWIVNPNNGNAEFVAPSGAITVCLECFLTFEEGYVYPVLNNDTNNGWITLGCHSVIVEMPYYVFARYFDAEAFVRGRIKDPSALARAVPFDYKPTLPCKSCERNEG